MVDKRDSWHSERGRNAYSNRSEPWEDLKIKGYTRSDGTRVKGYKRRSPTR